MTMKTDGRYSAFSIILNSVAAKRFTRDTGLMPYMHGVAPASTSLPNDEVLLLCNSNDPGGANTPANRIR